MISIQVFYNCPKFHHDTIILHSLKKNDKERTKKDLQ